MFGLWPVSIPFISSITGDRSGARYPGRLFLQVFSLQHGKEKPRGPILTVWRWAGKLRAMGTQVSPSSWCTSRCTPHYFCINPHLPQASSLQGDDTLGTWLGEEPIQSSSDGFLNVPAHWDIHVLHVSCTHMLQGVLFRWNHTAEFFGGIF